MTMKLREAIREVRQCKSASAERSVITKELANIRVWCKCGHGINYRHRNVAKLIYFDMMGYATHFGQMEVLKLLSSKGFVEKRLGYLALTQLLDENCEVLMLATQALKQDMQHENAYIVGLSLCVIGNITSTDMLRELAGDLQKLMKHSNPFVRKKALCAAIRVIKRLPEMCSDYFKSAVCTLEDSSQTHASITAAAQLLYSICRTNSKYCRKLRKYSPFIVSRLKSLCGSGAVTDYDINGVTDPFLQVHLLKLLRLACMGNQLNDEVDEILAQIAVHTEPNKDTGSCVLYECVRTIMSIEKQTSLHVLATNILGKFLISRNNNKRLIALKTLCDAVHKDAIQRYRNSIVDCLKDDDIMIRKHALDLIYSMSNKKNIKSLSMDLLNFLTFSDVKSSAKTHSLLSAEQLEQLEFIQELASKICMMVERYAPTRKWHIDTVIHVMTATASINGLKNREQEVVSSLFMMISNTVDLQGYCVYKLYECINKIHIDSDALRQLSAWLIGEYGDKLVDETECKKANEILLKDQNNRRNNDDEKTTRNIATNNINPFKMKNYDEIIEVILYIMKHKNSSQTTKGIGLTSLVKLAHKVRRNSIDDKQHAQKIYKIIEQFKNDKEIEIQQRCVEYLALFDNLDSNARNTILKEMPIPDLQQFSVVTANDDNKQNISDDDDDTTDEDSEEEDDSDDSDDSDSSDEFDEEETQLQQPPRECDLLSFSAPASTQCVDLLGDLLGGMGSAAPSCETIGLSVGGAKDTNNFRKCIEQNIMPSLNSITYTGLLYQYYFDTKKKHHDTVHEVKNNDDGSMLFYPSYCYAKVKKLNVDDSDKIIDDNTYEYYMSIGLNSNIKKHEFKRKHLNLVVVLDQSGSMRSTFYGEYNKTKMEIANQSVITLLNHLTKQDRFGMVMFDNSCTVIQQVKCIEKIDMYKLEHKILSIPAAGGTNFKCGYDGAINLFQQLFNHDKYACCNEYDNRIIFLTDAQPNYGVTDSNSLLEMVKRYATGNNSISQNNNIENDVFNRIYTTFIGIGLDFNAQLIEKISKTRGCNYYAVKSTKDFKRIMDEDFEYMVTPLVFNVSLKLICEGNVCEIEKVYGSSSNDIMTNGEITRIDTLFASKKRSRKKGGGTKGGISIIKLKKNINNTNDNNNMNVSLEVTFEDRNNKKYKNTQHISLKSPKINLINDIIEMDEKEEINEAINCNFYDNLGIRKGILLCKYVELMRQWISPLHSASQQSNYRPKQSDYRPQPFEAYNQNGISVTFNFVPSVQNNICRIFAVFHNSNSYDIDNFSFMVAVPKYIKFQVKPATGTKLLALSQNSITQKFQLTNTMYGQKPFIIRVQITYTHNGQQLRDRSQIQFPEHCNTKIINNNYSNTSSKLEINDKFKKIFVKFSKYFEKEMIKCEDDSLQKELDIIQILINL